MYVMNWYLYQKAKFGSMELIFQHNPVLDENVVATDGNDLAYNTAYRQVLIGSLFLKVNIESFFFPQTYQGKYKVIYDNNSLGLVWFLQNNRGYIYYYDNDLDTFYITTYDGSHNVILI